MNVWVVGSGGTLGKDLVEAFRAHGHEVVATDRAEVDITNESSVFDYAHAHTPNLIINAAAYNAVDAAEEEDGWKMARAINGDAPGILARAASLVGARFVHYSTDYVFSGTKGSAYQEDDVPDPVSKYGESKALGERCAQEGCVDTLVLRTSKLFGAQGSSEMSKRSFVDVMLQKAAEGDVLTLVDEEVGCPTYTPHLAERTRMLIEENAAPGMYHIVNEGEGVTWYGFAKEIFDVAGVSAQMSAVSGDAFPRKAKRPRAVVLASAKVSGMPRRRDALAEYLKQRSQ